MRVLLVGDYPPPYGGVADPRPTTPSISSRARGRGEGARHREGRPAGSGRHPGPTRRRLRPAARGIPRAGWTVHVHTSGNNPKSWMLAAAGWARMPGPRSPRVITLHSGLLSGLPGGSRGPARVRARGAGGLLAGGGGVQAVRDALVACGVPEEKILVHPAFCASQVQPGPVTPEVEAARARRSPLLAMAHHPSPVYGRKLMFRALGARARRRTRAWGWRCSGRARAPRSSCATPRDLGVAGLLEDLGELEHAKALGLLSQCDVLHPAHDA